MIKISVNANRSDIAGYISYYSAKEIAPMLEIDEKEIVYESAVVDYFAYGDIDFATRVEALVTITDNYVDHIGDINDILAKYLSGFVSEFDIRYQIIDSNLVYSFKVEGRPECECGEECHCHEHGCECGEECHCHEHGCECDDDCHCHEHEEGCHCGCHHEQEHKETNN